MATVEIGPKIFNFTINECWLYIDGEKVSKELMKEFEEEVLCKPVVRASGQELQEAFQHLGSELNRYLMTYKDSWNKWKEWAEGQLY